MVTSVNVAKSVRVSESGALKTSMEKRTASGFRGSPL
jgi:hypothetical protein